MPILNSRGDDCTGVGDGIIAVNGVVPAPLVGVVGGGTRWMGPRAIGYQRNDAGVCRLEQLDLETGERTALSPLGANRIEAGGGVLAAGMGREPRHPEWEGGYRDTLGRSDWETIDGRRVKVRAWYPLGVNDPTGDVAVCLDYNAGAGLAIVHRDGSQTPVWTGPLDRIDEGESSFRDGVLVFRAGGALRVRRPDGTIIVSTLRVAGARQAGGYLVGWAETNALVLYSLGQSVGLPISYDGQDFNADLAVLPSGLVRIVTSTTQGDRPQDRRCYLVNPVLGTVERTWLPAAAPDRVLQRTWADLTIGAIRVAQTTRPIAVGIFGEDGGPNLTGYDTTGQRDWPADPQTVGILVTLERDDVAHAAARGVREGLPLYLYGDHAGLRVPELPPYAGARRLAMPRTNNDPTVPRQTAADELRTSVRNFRGEGIDVVIDIQLTRGITFDAAGQPVYPWTERDVLERAIDAWEIAVQEGALAVWCYEQTRAKGLDGIDAWPSFRAFVDAIRAATPDWRLFPKSIPPKPVPTPAPKPSQELLMSARLAKSRLTPSLTFPGRWLYRLSTGRYLSVDGSTGTLRPEGTATDGDSEAFEWDGASDHCDIAPGNADGLRFPFGVDLNR